MNTDNPEIDKGQGPQSQNLQSTTEELNFWGKFAIRDNFGIPVLLHYYLMEDREEGENRLRRFLQNFGEIRHEKGYESLRNRIRRGFGEKCLCDYIIKLLQYGSYQFDLVKKHLEIIFEEKPEIYTLFANIMIRDRIVARSRYILSILNNKTCEHKDKHMFMNYYENLLESGNICDMNSELSHRLSNLIEDKLGDIIWYACNKLKFKNSNWCKGLRETYEDYEINSDVLDNQDMLNKISWTSERKKFIEVSEGHGEWLDGELIRGLTDTVYLGITKFRESHICGFEKLGEVIRGFGMKLGYKGHPLLVIGGSQLLNGKEYRKRVASQDSKRSLWNNTITEEDYDWMAVHLCDQFGRMDFEEVMHRVVWVTREDQGDCKHMPDEKDHLVDRLAWTQDTFKKKLNKELREEDKRALFYYYTCKGVSNSKRNSMLLQHLVEDPQITLKYLFLDDGKGNVLLDGQLKCILKASDDDTGQSQNREFLLKKIFEFLGNRQLEIEDLNRLYYELGWAFVGQKTELSFTMECLEKIDWKKYLSVRNSDSIILKSLRNFQMVNVSKNLLRTIIQNLKTMRTEDLDETLRAAIDFHFKKILEMILCQSKQIKIKFGKRTTSIAEFAETSNNPDNNLSAKSNFATPYQKTHKLTLMNPKNELGFQDTEYTEKANITKSTRVILGSMYDLPKDEAEPTKDILELQRNMYKALIEEFTKVDSGLWSHKISNNERPGKLFRKKLNQVKLLELEITYPYFRRDMSKSFIEPKEKEVTLPNLAVFKYQFQPKLNNIDTYLDLWWQERHGQLNNVLSKNSVAVQTSKTCWTKVWEELCELINGQGYNSHFNKANATHDSYVEHFMGEYYTEFVTINKSREFLPKEGFEGFEIMNFQIVREPNEETSVKYMKGFFKKVGAQKDLINYVRGRNYANVIFYPHRDLKSKVHHPYEDLLILNESQSFIKSQKALASGPLPTLFIYCKGQVHRLDLLWEYLMIFQKSSNELEMKDLVLKSMEKFCEDWKVPHIKNFARDVFSFEELNVFIHFQLFDRRKKRKNISTILRKTYNLQKLFQKQGELQKQSKSHIDDLLEMKLITQNGQTVINQDTLSGMTLKKLVSTNNHYNLVGLDERKGIEVLIRDESIRQVFHADFKQSMIVEGYWVGNFGNFAFKKKTSKPGVDGVAGDPEEEDTGQTVKEQVLVNWKTITFVKFIVPAKDDLLVELEGGNTVNSPRAGPNTPKSINKFGKLQAGDSDDSRPGSRNSRQSKEMDIPEARLSGYSMASPRNNSMASPRNSGQVPERLPSNFIASNMKKKEGTHYNRGFTSMMSGGAFGAIPSEKRIDIIESSQTGLKKSLTFNKHLHNDLARKGTSKMGFFDGTVYHTKSRINHTKTEFHSMTNFNYYMVKEHFQDQLTNCIRDIGDDGYISIEFDLMSYVNRSLKYMIKSKNSADFKPFVDCLAAYIWKKYKYYTTNLKDTHKEAFDGFTPLELLEKVFNLDATMIGPLKNKDFFIGEKGWCYSHLWTNESNFEELVELLMNEWSCHKTNTAENVMKWLGFIEKKKADRKLLAKIFLLIQHIKMCMKKDEYCDYIPRIIEGLINARCTHMGYEYRDFFLIRKRSKIGNNCFKNLQFMKKINEICVFALNMQKKMKLTKEMNQEETRKTFEETEDQSNTLAPAHISKMPRRRSIYKKDTISDKKTKETFFCLCPILDKANLEILKSNRDSIGDLSDEFLWFDTIAVMNDIEEELSATEGKSSKDIKEWFSVIRLYLCWISIRRTGLFKHEDCQKLNRKNTENQSDYYSTANQNSDTKDIIKSIRWVSEKLNDKRLVTRLFNSIKNQIYKSDDVRRKEIEVLVRVVDCTNNLEIKDVQTVLLTKDFSKHPKVESIILEGVHTILSILLGKERCTADPQITQILSEKSENKAMLYDRIKPIEHIWNTFLYYKKDSEYDQLSFYQKLPWVSKYGKEAELQSFLRGVDDKNIDSKMIWYIAGKLGDKMLKFFLEEKYLAKHAFTSQDKLNDLFSAQLLAKKDKMIQWVLEKLYLNMNKNREKFEVSVINILNHNLMYLGVHDMVQSSEVANWDSFQNHKALNEAKSRCIYENYPDKYIIHDLLVSHNTHFYYRFRKFWSSFLIYPGQLKFMEKVGVNEKYYDNFAVTRALPGIRPASQKLEKVIQPEMVETLTYDLDKLLIAGEAVTIWEDYNYLFIQKKPKVDPMVAEFIKCNKYYTYVPQTTERLIQMVVDKQIYIDFVNSDPLFNLYYKLANKFKNQQPLMLNLSLLNFEECDLSVSHLHTRCTYKITVTGQEYQLAMTNDVDEFYNLTFGSPNLSIPQKVKLAAQLLQQQSQYTKEVTFTDKDTIDYHMPIFQKSLICLILLYMEKDDELLDITLINTKKEMFEAIGISDVDKQLNDMDMKDKENIDKDIEQKVADNEAEQSKDQTALETEKTDGPKEDLEYQDLSAQLADVSNLDKLFRIYAKFAGFDNLIRNVMGKAVVISTKFYEEPEAPEPPAPKTRNNLDLPETEPNEKDNTPRSFFSELTWMNDVEWEEHIRSIFCEMIETHDLRLEQQLGHIKDKTELTIKRLSNIRGMEQKAQELAQKWYVRPKSQDLTNFYNENVVLHSNDEFERSLFQIKRDFWSNMNDKITSGNFIRKELIIEWSRAWIKTEKNQLFKRVYDTWFHKLATDLTYRSVFQKHNTVEQTMDQCKSNLVDTMDWVAISNQILEIIKKSAFGEEKPYYIINSQQDLGDHAGTDNMNHVGVVHKDIYTERKENCVKKLVSQYSGVGDNEEPTHLLNEQWLNIINTSYKELIKNRSEIITFFVDNQQEKFYAKIQAWKANDKKVQKIEENMMYFASDLEIILNLNVWTSQLVASNDLHDVDYDVFQLQLDGFQENLSRLVIECDYIKLRCIEGIKFQYVSYKDVNKGHVNQLETYLAQSRLLDTKVERILTGKVVKKQSRQNCQTEQEYADEQEFYEEPPDKIELVIVLSYQKDLGMIIHWEILRSLFADRTDFGKDYHNGNYDIYWDVMPSLNMLKNDLRSNFQEGFIKHINTGLDMYKYVDLKFKKFRNFGSYYNNSGKDVLLADFAVHLANQFVETPIIDTIQLFLRDKVEKRHLHEKYSQRFINEDKTQVENHRQITCELEIKDSTDPDEGDREYWEVLSDSGDNVDMTNFMFRVLIKEKKNGGVVLLQVSLQNLDFKEFLQKYCKNKFLNMDMLDKKLVREKQKAIDENKNEIAENKVVINNKWHLTGDRISAIKYSSLLRNSTKDAIGHIIYNLSLVPKKGHCVLAMKDQLLNNSNGRILRGEDCWLEEGGLPFYHFMEHVILDIDGFHCRLEQIEESYTKKTLFIGNPYPKDEVYILKVCLLRTDSYKTNLLSDDQLDCKGYRCTQEYGFILGLNNLRQTLQCLFKNEKNKSLSYHAITKKILQNLCSFLTYKVYPNIEALKVLREESNKDSDRFTNIISTADGDLYETNPEDTTNTGFSDSNVELCNSVMVSLVLRDDDLDQRVIELTEDELNGYFKQSVKAIHQFIDKENIKAINPEEQKEIKNFSICMITVNMSRQFFEEENQPQTFMKNPKCKKYKSQKQLKEDVLKCFVDIDVEPQDQDEEHLKRDIVFEWRMKWLYSEPKCKLAQFDNQQYLLGFERRWTDLDITDCLTTNELKKIKEDDMFGLKLITNSQKQVKTTEFMYEIGSSKFQLSMKNCRQLGREMAEMAYQIMTWKEVGDDSRGFSYNKSILSKKLQLFREVFNKLKFQAVYERDLDIIKHEKIEKQHEEQIARSVADFEKSHHSGHGRISLMPVVSKNTKERSPSQKSQVCMDEDFLTNRPDELIEVDILKFCANDWNVITGGRPRSKTQKNEIGKKLLISIFKQLEDAFLYKYNKMIGVYKKLVITEKRFDIFNQVLRGDDKQSSKGNNEIFGRQSIFMGRKNSINYDEEVLNMFDIIDGGRWMLDTQALANWIEEFYNTNLKRYVNANDWERNMDIQVDVIYDIVGIKENFADKTLELCMDNIRNRSALSNENELIQLFMKSCQQDKREIDTYFQEIGVKFPYKCESESIRTDKMNILYINGDKGFKSTKYSELLNGLKGKVIKSDKKEKLVTTLGERFGVLINAITDKIPKDKRCSLGLIIKKDKDGTQFDFYWCRGQLLNNKIEKLGSVFRNCSLKMMECLILHEDRGNADAQNNPVTESQLCVQKTTKAKMANLKKLLKGFNRAFIKECSKFKGLKLMDKGKIDYYSIFTAEETEAEGGLLVRCNNVVLKRLTDMCKANRDNGKFHFNVVNTQDYESYQIFNSNASMLHDDLSDNICNTLCVRHVTSDFGDQNISVLKYIRRAFYNENSKNGDTGDFKKAKNARLEIEGADSIHEDSLWYKESNNQKLIEKVDDKSAAVMNMVGQGIIMECVEDKKFSNLQTGDASYNSLLYKVDKKVIVGETVEVVLELYSDTIKLTNEALAKVTKNINFVTQLKTVVKNKDSSLNRIIKMEMKADHEVKESHIVVKAKCRLTGTLEVIMIKDCEKELVAIVKFGSDKFNYKNSSFFGESHDKNLSKDLEMEFYEEGDKDLIQMFTYMKNESKVASHIAEKGCLVVDDKKYIENSIKKVIKTSKDGNTAIKPHVQKLANNISGSKMFYIFRDKNQNCLTGQQLKPLENDQVGYLSCQDNESDMVKKLKMAHQIKSVEQPNGVKVDVFTHVKFDCLVKKFYNFHCVLLNMHITGEKAQEIEQMLLEMGQLDNAGQHPLEIKLFVKGQSAEGLPQNWGMIGFQIVKFEATTQKDRYENFHKQIPKGSVTGCISLLIDRKNILNSIKEGLVDKIKKNFRETDAFAVRFKGEPGVDCGGPTKEFFDIFGVRVMAELSKLFVMNSDGRLIMDSKANRYDSSGEFINIIGKIVGKSIKIGRFVGVGFSNVICKYLMGRHIDNTMLEDLLTATKKDSIKQLLAASPNNILLEKSQWHMLKGDELQKFFSSNRLKAPEYESMIGKMGKEVLTSEENEMLRTCQFEYYMYGLNNANQPLLKKLKDGFWEGLGDMGIFENHFSSEDISLQMIGGQSNIRWEMFDKIFVYSGYAVQKNSKFWKKSFRNLDQLGIRRMLRAITGSSAFDALSNGFRIRISFFNKGRYQKDMVLHACSNDLDVIDCENQEEMDLQFIANFSSDEEVYTIG